MPRRIGINEQKRRKEMKQRVSKRKPGRTILLFILLLAAIRFMVPRIDTEWYVCVLRPSTQINSLIITGNTIVGDEVIRKLVNIDSTTSIFSIDPDTITARLSSLEAVKKVRIHRSLTRDVTISIQEHAPCGYVILDNQVYFANNAGILWPFSAGTYYDIPVITGVEAEMDDAGNFRMTSTYLREFKQIREVFKNEGVFAHLVSLDMEDGDMITIHMKGVEPEIRFSPSVADDMLMSMNAVFEFISSNDISVKEYIDLSYDKVAFIK
jgi:cell division septal protein FtsQ